MQQCDLAFQCLKMKHHTILGGLETLFTLGRLQQVLLSSFDFGECYSTFKQVLKLFYKIAQQPALQYGYYKS